MFNFFKKKKKNQAELFSVCDGEFKKIENVNDQVFADKIMGDGFAISPVSGKVKVTSPVKGKVMSIFPTKHAITFITPDNLEVLVHMGIDTVALKGEGFTLFVKENQDVDENTVLAEMDVDYIVQQEKDKDIIVVFTNLEENQPINITHQDAVKHSQLIGSIDL